MTDFETWMRTWGARQGAGQIYTDLAKLTAQQHEALGHNHTGYHGYNSDSEQVAVTNGCVPCRAIIAAQEFQEKCGT